MSTTKIRVTCAFVGRQAGALGACFPHRDVRRTIEVPERFTEEEAREAARKALYEVQDGGFAYERVSCVRVAFN